MKNVKFGFRITFEICRALVEVAVIGQLVATADDSLGGIAVGLGSIAGHEEGRRKVVAVQEIEHPINADPRSV